MDFALLDVEEARNSFKLMAERSELLLNGPTREVGQLLSGLILIHSIHSHLNS